MLTNVADVVNPDSGKTFRQENLVKSHRMPVNSLVEVNETGERLYIKEHTRDCDGTPLYSLGMFDEVRYERKFNIFSKIHHGFSEQSLKLIK